MSRNILDSFYENLTNDHVCRLGTCIDEYYHFTNSPNHKELADKLLHTEPTIRSAFFQFLWEALLWNRKTVLLRLRLFMTLPLSQMPLYILEFPDEIKKQTLCPPPIPGRGPLSWQVILARWRLLISL
jgi:hypothetical protein